MTDNIIVSYTQRDTEDMVKYFINH